MSFCSVLAKNNESSTNRIQVTIQGSAYGGTAIGTSSEEDFKTVCFEFELEIVMFFRISSG